MKKRLQPVNMSANAPGQTVFSIGYDFHVGNGTTGSDNGNVWNIYNYRDRTRDQSFNYDALNRLTSAQNAGTNCAAATVNGKTEYWGNTYGYDPWGNLTAKSVTKCSAENLSLSALVNNQLSGYGYDAAGNMTSDPTDSVTSTYDAENRIATANTPQGVFTYTYDADGNRVEKSGGGTGTLYWYMTPGIIGESDLSGTMKSEYVFFNGDRVARRDLPSGSVAYYFSGHLKTASVITDSAGNIKSESDYYPWGGELQFVNNDSNHYKFTGKERDSESGLDYFGARYYSNGLGRFITPDWAAKAVDVPYAEFSDSQSLNLYSYVRNIPTSRSDSDGHCSGPLCQSVKVAAEVDQKPRIVKNVTLKDISGKSVGKATGVQGSLVDTVTVNGKPAASVKVTETNNQKITVNGKQQQAQLLEGKATTNQSGKFSDTIGALKSTSGSKADNKAIEHAFRTTPFTITDKQVLSLTFSNGATCDATSTRTLTNTGTDGKASSHFSLTTTQPVVTGSN